MKRSETNPELIGPSISEHPSARILSTTLRRSGWWRAGSRKTRLRGFIQAMVEGELEETLPRLRYGGAANHRAAMVVDAQSPRRS
jgi:hypothetical protein